MELALIVYLISLLPNISNFLGFAIFFLVVSAIVMFMVSGLEFENYSWHSAEQRQENARMKKLFAKYGRRSIIGVIVFGCITVFIPSERTAYLMVGAYTAQKVAENPKVQELSGKVIKVIETKIDSYIEEATELAEKKAEKK